MSVEEADSAIWKSPIRQNKAKQNPPGQTDYRWVLTTFQGGDRWTLIQTLQRTENEWAASSANSTRLVHLWKIKARWEECYRGNYRVINTENPYWHIMPRKRTERQELYSIKQNCPYLIMITLSIWKQNKNSYRLRLELLKEFNKVAEGKINI